MIDQAQTRMNIFQPNLTLPGEFDAVNRACELGEANHVWFPRNGGAGYPAIKNKILADENI